MIMFSMGKKEGRLQQNIPNIPSPTFQHVSSVVIFSPWLAWPNRQENGGLGQDGGPIWETQNMAMFMSKILRKIRCYHRMLGSPRFSDAPVPTGIC